MKSEERHDIETNELAKLLTSDKIAPYLSYVIYGLLALAAVWAIFRLTAGNMSSKQLRTWDSYTIATLPGRFDAEQLKSAATEYAGEPVGELAQIAWADSQLAVGCQNYFANKKQAMQQLDDALEEYKKLSTTASDKNLRGRAQLGIAKALEAKGEVKEAIAAYEAVSGAFGEIAENRGKYLEEVDAGEYAAWLATAEGSRTPTNFGSGSRPDFSADPLNLPGGNATTGGVDEGEDFLEMLRRYQESAPDAKDAPDRYEQAGSEPAADQPEGDETSAEPAESDTTSAGESETNTGDEPLTEEVEETRQETEGESP